jgi:hypothetical protein
MLIKAMALSFGREKKGETETERQEGRRIFEFSVVLNSVEFARFSWLLSLRSINMLRASLEFENLMSRRGCIVGRATR